MENQTIQALSTQLAQANELNSRLSAAMQQELMQNREVRAEMKTRVDQLQKVVDDLNDVIHGDADHDSLKLALHRLQEGIDDLNDRMSVVEKEREEEHDLELQSRRAIKDKFWDLILHNSPTIVAALGALAYWVISKLMQ